MYRTKYCVANWGRLQRTLVRRGDVTLSGAKGEPRDLAGIAAGRRAAGKGTTQ